MNQKNQSPEQVESVFDKIKINDILYQYIPKDKMEGWWVVRRRRRKTGYVEYECELVHSVKPVGCTNGFLDFFLTKFTPNLKIIGTLNDFPEWQL